MGKRAQKDPADDRTRFHPSASGSAAVEVGRRLRSLRTGQGWTLDELAARSGVSRRMIVNIEQGSANASIATLLRLSSSFRISLSALVVGLENSGRPGWQVRRAGERTVLWSGEHGGQAVMVTSAHVPDMVELWDWTLGPGDRHESEAHAAGTCELVHVLSGQVLVTVQNGDGPCVPAGVTTGGAESGETVELAAGDALTFPGDRPHSYNNPGRSRARFALTVYEPVRRAR